MSAYGGASSLPRVAVYGAEPESVVLRPVGGEWVAFHRPSGQTHFLNDTATTILTWLMDRPLSVEELEARLADRGVPPGRVSALLARFDQLGLVRVRELRG